MTKQWKAFFEKSRFNGNISRDTLLEQVGRTINGKPVDQQEFDLSTLLAIEKLKLEKDDVLFEYCCGNGVVSYELSKHVRFLIGTDFTEHLIESANLYRSSENITYRQGNALDPIKKFIGDKIPNKFLMSFALAHFQPDELHTILADITSTIKNKPVSFLISGIPDEDQKWNFYNTPERKQRYLELSNKGDLIFDGIGRWWTANEIKDIAAKHGFSSEKFIEPGKTNHFRMAILLERQ